MTTLTATNLIEHAKGCNTYEALNRVRADYERARDAEQLGIGEQLQVAAAILDRRIQLVLLDLYIETSNLTATHEECLKIYNTFHAAKAAGTYDFLDECRFEKATHMHRTQLFRQTACGQAFAMLNPRSFGHMVKHYTGGRDGGVVFTNDRREGR